jgi:leucyl aminopeptidase
MRKEFPMLKFNTTRLERFKSDNMAIAVCEDADIHADPAVRELIAKATALEEFAPEKDRQVVLHNVMRGRVVRCLFIGLGPKDKLTPESFRTFAGRAVKEAMGAKQKGIALAVPLDPSLGMDARVVVAAMLEGAFLANHSDTRYKEKPKNNVLKSIALCLPAQPAKTCRTLIARTEAICGGVLQAREWVNTPPNEKVPEQLATAYAQMAKAAGLKVNVLHAPQLKRQNFNALLAVAGGSSHPPCLVEMIHAPAKAKKTIVLVGKGVTFDTGGINLKPSAGLDTMKADMAGSAAVAGAMAAVARLKPGVRIVGVTPIVENMPSGSATRPGDIITSYAGKTVEIGNTDAEGRLILIDAMAYAAKKYKPDVLIDLATLTGACVVALGEKIAGVFSPDDALAEAVVAAGERTAERCWRMPMPEDYRDLLKSELADINNNASSRYGGAIAAALFLSEFIGDQRWAHIDIAGPAYLKKGPDYGAPGATGFGVRLLCDLIEHL